MELGVFLAMNKQEIQFYKHCLQDYKYYRKRIYILESKLDNVISESVAILYPKNYPDGKIGNSNPYRTLYDSKDYQIIAAKKEAIMNEIVIFKNLMKITDQFLLSVDPEIKSILRDLYILEIPAKQVADAHYYSDEKSMYRSIRNTLARM